MIDKKNTKPNLVKLTKHTLNNSIRATDVRLIGDNIENSGDIYTISEALTLSKSLDLDLVEVSPNANPPVCKIVDYQKFLYMEDKKQRDLEKKQRENNKALKEIQFSPNIGVADIVTKSKHIREFLTDGHKVKIVMKFKQGREIQNSLTKGEAILLDIILKLEDVAKAESLPRLNGKMMTVLLNPKK